jgi:hypothetical protein
MLFDSRARTIEVHVSILTTHHAQLRYRQVDTTDKVSHVKPNLKNQRFWHQQECAGGVKFIEMLQNADSLQLGCDTMCHCK